MSVVICHLLSSAGVMNCKKTKETNSTVFAMDIHSTMSQNSPFAHYYFLAMPWKVTDFSNFWYTTSRRNVTLEKIKVLTSLTNSCLGKFNTAIFRLYSTNDFDQTANFSIILIVFIILQLRTMALYWLMFQWIFTVTSFCQSYSSIYFRDGLHPAVHRGWADRIVAYTTQWFCLCILNSGCNVG